MKNAAHVTGRFLAVLVGLSAICFVAPAARAEVRDCVTNMSGGIMATPQNIALGQSSTLTWGIDGPRDCPLWVNDRQVQLGGSLVVHPQTATVYVFSTLAPDGGRHKLDEVTVTVTPDCAAQTRGALTALPRTVHIGDRTTLRWSVSRPQSCTQRIRLNGQTVQATGNLSIQPGTTTTYVLVILFPDHQKELARVTVVVNTRTVHIRGNTRYWKTLLVQSLARDGTKIVLGPNVNMSLSGLGPIHIRESVILTSGGGTPDPAAPLRNARNLGPRLYTTTRPKPLFLIECNSDNSIVGNNVRISGFRLHGPHFGVMDGDANLENGIKIVSCVNVEIFNMEIAGWSGQAIYVAEHASAPRMTNPDAVRIHDNYIHSNQHVGESGYGVVVKEGAQARIERNVFDLNRHAIAAAGAPGVVYYAENNLVLKGGGIHGKIFNAYTHQFDVHGDQSCPFFIPDLLNCGNAGHAFRFINNSFQYLRDNALKIRGKPRGSAYIWGNVFAHSELGDAVALRTRTNVYFGQGQARNIVGVDTYGQYGICDLDGDGKDDLFLATGKTWWYSSAGKMHWVFLKAATERLHEVGLGYFDGDRRCDVLTAGPGDRWGISSGGSGEWTALPGIYPIPFNQLRFADFNGDGRTDIFRRAPNGQWSVISPGVHGWRLLQSSSLQLSELRFGDFTGDGVTDVLSRAGGRWSISRSGRDPWMRINLTLGTDLSSAIVADVDGDGIDDVVRFRATSALADTWEISWAGRTGWLSLRTVSVPPPSSVPRLVTRKWFAGKFNEARGTDLMLVDYERFGYLYSHPGRTLVRHNLFPY